MAIVFGSLPFILRRPQLGVIMYVWISVMNPHRLTWSFAYEFNFAAIVAAVTLVAAVISKDLKPPPLNTLMVALALFIVWTGVTTVLALQPEPSFERWKTLGKTAVMAFLIPMLFHKKSDLRLLIWVIVLSIAYYGTKGGVWTLLMGGEGRVWGPMGSYIQDNNALAVANIMTIPLMRYLQLTSPHRSVRWALTAMMFFCGVSVFGTYSRGAIVAACGMVAFLWWKGRHKVAVLILIALAIPFALSSMPEKWYARMDTIANYHQERSAQMRLNAWGTMWNIAKDRPITGGGFELASKEIFARYSPDPTFPPQAAHSIYLQALAEHGFVGLLLYLSMLGGLWRTSTSIVRSTPHAGNLGWAHDLARMMQVTLVGFAIGGVFLSLVNFDVPYYLVGIGVAVAALLDREAKARSKQTTDKSAAPMAQQPRPIG
jgi:putative inorganic carbon (HCO3(-)) transporter